MIVLQKMKNKICINVVLICLLLLLSACGSQNEPPQAKDESKDAVSSSADGAATQSAEDFDIKEYADKNGYSLYYADAVSPIHWLLIGDNGIG